MDTAASVTRHLRAAGLIGAAYQNAHTAAMDTLAGYCRRAGHDYQVTGVSATETTPGYPVEVECQRCGNRWPVPAPVVHGLAHPAEEKHTDEC